VCAGLVGSSSSTSSFRNNTVHRSVDQWRKKWGGSAKIEKTSCIFPQQHCPQVSCSGSVGLRGVWSYRDKKCGESEQTSSFIGWSKNCFKILSPPHLLNSSLPHLLTLQILLSSVAGIWLKSSKASEEAGCTELANATTYLTWDFGVVTTGGIETHVKVSYYDWVHRSPHQRE
jgi:hypothetical protein